MHKASFIFFGFLLLFKIDCFAQFGNETITITTYYPSPYGVYGILNLYPKDQAPQNPMQGDLYFDKNNETVKYYKNTTVGWVNLTAGGSAGGGISEYGSVVIPAGETTWRVTFSKTYVNTPLVIATPVGVMDDMVFVRNFNLTNTYVDFDIDVDSGDGNMTGVSGYDQEIQYIVIPR